MRESPTGRDRRVTHITILLLPSTPAFLQGTLCGGQTHHLPVSIDGPDVGMFASSQELTRVRNCTIRILRKFPLARNGKVPCSGTMRSDKPSDANF